MVHTARTEQGFRVRTRDDPSRTSVDLEGLTLVRLPAAAPRQKASGEDVVGEEDGEEAETGET